MLSNTCKYGIRAVLYLAQNDKENELIGIKRISHDLNIPMPFLGKILQTLAKQKLLNSTKGPHGGFKLARKANKISLMDVVEVLDGLDVFSTCMISLSSCAESHSDKFHCPIHEKYESIKEQTIKLFNDETFSSLLSDVEKSGKRIKI